MDTTKINDYIIAKKSCRELKKEILKTYPSLMEISKRRTWLASLPYDKDFFLELYKANIFEETSTQTGV